MVDCRSVSYEDLPYTVRELVDVIGLKAAMEVVAARGGARLCVPKRPTTEHWLSERIGMVAFSKFSQVYGGEEVEIPRCFRALLRLKEMVIYGEFGQGASIAKLALDHGYTERGMRKLIHRVKTNLKPPMPNSFS